MRKIVSVCTILTLAACAQPAEEEAAEADAMADEAVVEEVSALVGTYEGMTDEGDPWTASINADGTSEVMMDGELVDTSTWRSADDGTTCFTDTMLEEGEEATEMCYTFGDVGDDGVVEVTNADGEVNTVTKVS